MFLSNRWLDFELIDAGKGEKLERWGDVLVTRPEALAIWPHDEWPDVDAAYRYSKAEGGHWVLSSPLPTNWQITYPLEGGPSLVFSLQNMDYKHTGVFPEQASNWDYLYKQVKRIKKAKQETRFLNLFAYTGGATLAMAAGSPDEIVHIDAAKAMLGRAKDNQKLSQLDHVKVRYIPDDVGKFVKRERRRGRHYDGIVLDPPTFGRGPRGEMWQIEAQLPLLLKDLAGLLQDGQPAFVVLNTYSGMTVDKVDAMIKGALVGKGGLFETDELGLRTTNGKQDLSLGVTARWTR